MFDFILYKIGQFLSLVLPLKLSYHLAEFLADLKCFFTPLDRQAVIENLKAVTGEKDKKILTQYTYQMYHNFAKYLVDFFRFSKVDNNYIKKYIKIENLNYIDNILKKGKGLIALSAHLGNWELGAMILAKLGYPLNAIVLDHQEKLVNHFFVKQRSLGGLKMIPLGASIRRTFECLSNNEILAILADRDFLKNGFKMNFFNKPSIIPKGPALLSLRLSSPIVPVFLIREPDDTFSFVFDAPIYFSPTGNRDSDLVALTQACVKVMERHIRRYPSQWFMFRKFWED